jgi:dUTP pyrophosphatase
MTRIKIKVKIANGTIPSYQSEGASGLDLVSSSNEDIKLEPGKRALIPTGIYLEIPEGFEGQVRPRSGLAAKNGITVLNTPGTIDSDYRGEVKVILINLGLDDFVVKRGDRIAQIVFMPVVRAELCEEISINSTERGTGGFGSTGI